MGMREAKEEGKAGFSGKAAEKVNVHRVESASQRGAEACCSRSRDSVPGRTKGGGHERLHKGRKNEKKKSRKIVRKRIAEG